MLVYDFLFGQGVQCGGELKQCISRNKAALQSSLARLKVRAKVHRNEDLLPKAALKAGMNDKETMLSGPFVNYAVTYDEHPSDTVCSELHFEYLMYVHCILHIMCCSVQLYYYMHMYQMFTIYLVAKLHHYTGPIQRTNTPLHFVSFTSQANSTPTSKLFFNQLILSQLNS